MWVMLLGAAIGLTTGLLRGGRIRHLGVTHFRLWLVLVAGVVLQAGAVVFPRPVAPTALVASYAMLVLFGIANIRFAGMAIVAVGMAMNAATITVNGGMPVRGEAIVAAGIAESHELRRLDFGSKRHLARDDDVLMPLSDIIPVPWTREVLSFGDLVIAVGLADVLYHLVRHRRHHLPEPVREAAAL